MAWGNAVRIAAAALSISGAGLIGIAVHEDWRPTAYLPTPNDKLTVGFGSTKDVKPGQTITVTRGLIRLKEDATEAEQAVKKCADVPMFQYEYDAWVSFTFNVGGNAFCASTASRLLREYKYAEACAQMDRWIYQGNDVLPGLVNRRKAERALCEGRG